MGTFDTVLIRCPNCGYGTEEKSNAGEGSYITRSEDSVPIEIADDLIERLLNCRYCLTVFKVVERIPEPTGTKMLKGIKI